MKNFCKKVGNGWQWMATRDKRKWYFIVGLSWFKVFKQKCLLMFRLTNKKANEKFQEEAYNTHTHMPNMITYSCAVFLTTSTSFSLTLFQMESHTQQLQCYCCRCSRKESVFFTQPQYKKKIIYKLKTLLFAKRTCSIRFEIFDIFFVSHIYP